MQAGTGNAEGGGGIGKVTNKVEEVRTRLGTMAARNAKENAMA